MRKNRRILLVDDEPYNLIALQIILQKSGYPFIQDSIDTANNGLEAVKKIEEAFENKNYSYGLIFMDLSMPVMDGFDATKQIRQFVRGNGLAQPMIVACTGHTEEEFIAKAWLYQIDEVMSKPCDIFII